MSKRITIPDQSYYNLPEKKLKNFEEPDNCDPVLLCTSTDMETIWAWCVVLIRQFFKTRTVWKEKEKRHPDFVIERECSNELYELGCFPIKPTCIIKTIIWPTLSPLAYTNLVP